MSWNSIVGFRVLPDRIRIRSDNLHRGRDRLKLLKSKLAQGQITPFQFKQSCTSWQAHLAHGNTQRLQQRIFGDNLLD